MDAQQFLAEFGHIANAPNGISQLRELVLVLAVTGRLFKSSVSVAEPAIEFVTKIERELADYKEAHKYRRSNGDAEPKQNIQFSAPSNWALANLGQLGVLIRGVSYNKSVARDCAQDDFTGLLRANNIGALVTFGNLVYVPSKIVDPEQLLQAGDILIAMSSGSKDLVGKAALVRNAKKYAFGAFCGVYRCMPSMNSEFIRVIMQSPIYRAYVSDQGKGIGINNLTKGHIEDYQFYLPPTDEQSRIVAKVDELMALCDKLEAQQLARRKLQNNLRLSTLQAVAAASSPHELQAAWSRLADNFARLFHVPEDVADLRNLILDLAVHGLLVQQSDTDAPIGEWFLEIAAQKADLTRQKLISKQTALGEIAEDEFPFPLPKGWAFVRLGQIASKIGSGSTPRGGREVYVKTGIPFLRSQNIWNDGLRLDDVACITTEENERMSGTAVLGNDVLLNITGASLGRCALVPAEFGEANVSQHVTIIRLTDPQVREYLHLCILSPYTQGMIWGRQVGMAREGLSKKVLEQFEIPLPPIAEQHRIVARFAELMRFCDGLENQLRYANKLAERLVTTAVASITGITTDQKEEPMKAPQTELIAPVRLGQAPDIKAQAPLATLLARHNGEMPAKDLWQRFGGEIDAFYAQLKTEVAHGWILEPEPARVELID